MPYHTNIYYVVLFRGVGSADKSTFLRGDFIEIIEGGEAGIVGDVISIEGDIVTIKPKNLGELTVCVYVCMYVCMYVYII